MAADIITRALDSYEAQVRRLKAQRSRDRTAIHRAIDMLQRVDQGEPWTSREIERVLRYLRGSVCRACRDGEPHGD